MARYNYTVQYENNRGQKINLTELPYAINIEPLLDYSWAYATRDRRRGSRVAGFNKAVASKSVTLHILGTTVEERNEAIDAFNNIIEVDIYDGVAGKIWFDDWYTYGYIVASQNEKWQYDKGIIKKTIELVREEETWYHVIVKNSYSEIPDEDEDFELGIKDYELSPYIHDIHEVTETPDTTPYLFRPSPALTEDYDRLLLDKVVGGTLAVNQLVQTTDTEVTVTSGHKYLSKINDVQTVAQSDGTAIAINDGTKDNVFDLTAMFPTTIADYVYNLEQSTAGSGVAWLRQYYPSIFNSYQPYNAGTLESVEASAHVMTGFNQWDEEWRNGYYSGSTFVSDARFLANKNPIPVLPNTQYYMKSVNTEQYEVHALDADGNYISLISGFIANASFTTPTGARYINFNSRTANAITTYTSGICINISSSRNGEYEPYTQTSYPLDSTLTLRGIPKLNNGVPYYDGDEYKSVGSVNRRYGIVDLGTLNWLLNATNEFTASLTGSKGAVYAGVANAVCGEYLVDTYNHVHGHTTDKTIAVLSTNSYVYVYDTAYTDAAAFKTAMSGVYLIYELATPTTETADTYDRVQECYKGGTEEFVSSNVVPVGHETKYGLANLIGYNYDYDYGLDKVSQIEVTNPNPLGCNFVIAISGPVNDPYVKIGETVVNVNVEIPDGGYLTVDSGAKTIVLTMPDGQEINAFGARNPDYYIFQLIESGINPILWDGSFNWQLQMIEERSEPRWLMG